MGELLNAVPEIAGLLAFLAVAVFVFRRMEALIEPSDDRYDREYVPLRTTAPSEQVRAAVYDEAADTLPATRVGSGVKRNSADSRAA